MKNVMTKIGLGAVLAATALTAAAPADAQYYRGYRHRGDDAGIAIASGIAGLAIGAALTSGNYRDRDYYYREHGYRPDYDNYYYRGHGYYPSNGYYANYYNGYNGRCYIENRWDPYYGQRVRVRVCR